MQKQLFFLGLSIILLSTYTNIQSQNWRTSTLKEGSNYFEIIKKENERLKQLQFNTDQKSKKEIKQFNRWAAFWKDRILPDGSFVSATHTYNEWKKEQHHQNSTSFSEGVNDVNWSLIGPSSIPHKTNGGIGRISTVAFNSTDVNTLYVATPGGGVWKSTNGGTSWSPKGDNLGNIGVSDIVINPINTNILYLATGDWDGLHNRSIGVYKSLNGGDTWTLTGLTFSLNNNNIISKLLIDPNNVNTVFATTKNAIKRTTDGGTTWVDVLVENEAFFNDIQYKKGSSTTIYATAKSGKFYKSTNNGTTWVVASTPAVGGRVDFALTDHDVNLILILDEGGAVKKSTNEGATWTTLSTISGFTSQSGYNMAIAISPINKNLVLLGGILGKRSMDGGVNWVDYFDGTWSPGSPYTYAHVDHHDFKFVPGSNIAFNVNDGGIIKGDASLDISWTDLSASLAITQYYSVGGTPQNAGKLIGGAQDNDVTIFDGATTNIAGTGDGVNGLIDYSNPNIFWACGQLGFLIRTIDNFANNTVPTTPKGAPFVWELEIHPTVPTTIYGGFADIYKSTNRGDTWTSLNSGVGVVEFISIAPSNANIIYVSGEEGTPSQHVVKKTINGGTSWTDLNLPQDENVKSIEVHPTNPDEIYIAYSGYSAGKVYKSTDGGTTWTNITGSLPNVPTHQIRYKTGTTNGELFLATDLGVYYRTNTAGDWVKLGTGLPNIIVNDIEIHYATEKLRAATFGRGLWEVPIDAASLHLSENKLPENSVKLYPNPAKNKRFNIQLNNLKRESNVLIYNTIGSVVKNFNSSSKIIPVNLNDFSNGIYIVKITNSNRSLTKSLLID